MRAAGLRSPQQAGKPRLPRRAAVERVGVRLLLCAPQRVPTGARPLRRRQRRPNRRRPPRSAPGSASSAATRSTPVSSRARSALSADRCSPSASTLRRSWCGRNSAAEPSPAVDQQVRMRHLHPAQVEQLVTLPKLVVRPRPPRPLNQRHSSRPQSALPPAAAWHGKRLRRKHLLIHPPLLRPNQHVVPQHAHRGRCVQQALVVAEHLLQAVLPCGQQVNGVTGAQEHVA